MPTAGRRALRFFAVVLACVASASCRRLPGPPYALAFAIDVQSPRLLQTSREIAVPATLTNTGGRVWDASHMHLSYHWLWLVPRELASRSRWDIPYQNGIRSDLPQAIAPGARVVIDGRVLPPSWPGLYWLQWDMVEEGAAWFAQAAPRQPRTLVLVLPPLAWTLAPLPLLVAFAGLVAVRRQRRFAGIAPDAGDLCWCATALVVKPLIVVHDALLEPSSAGYWLLLAAAVVPPALALVVLPRRARAWSLVILGTLGSLVVLGDVVYYRFFGDVLSVPALLAARQTSQVWGSIRSLLSPILFWIVIDLPIAGALAFALSRSRSPAVPWRKKTARAASALVALLVVGAALNVPGALRATPLDQMFRDRSVVEQRGLFGFHAYDGWNYARSTWLRVAASDAQVADARAWFAGRAALRSARDSPLFGLARGKNLIVIQVESLQDFVVDFRVGGQEVMPHLRQWSSDSLRFTNVTDETNQGRTSDAEFTTMTSLLPLDQGAVAFRFPGNHYAALPRVLVEHGYATISAVAFEPGFWNRRVMHPSYGFQRTLFEPDFQLTEQIGWGLNDRDFLQQMLPRLEGLPRPFASWLITLSLHHPFDDFPDRHKVLALGALEHTSFGNYLHTMRFFDQALADFQSALARDGLLDSSVLVVFGDHDAGFARDAELARTIGIGADEAAWARNDRVPMFVRVPQATDALRGDRDVPAGQTDLAPTLLGLLGIDAGPLPYVGRNLLGAPGDGPVPRPYGDWLDAHHLYMAASAAACHDGAGRVVAAGDCAAADRDARRERDVSRLVVIEDLQQRLRAMLLDVR